MKTILVVEDEKDLRLNLQEMLEREGFNILTAANGVEALKLARTIEPDLILSDIRMPEMDGLELLKALQENSDTANIPFIFLTAKVEMQDLRDGMVMGADDYLVKPFKIDDVLSAINSRLRKKENHHKIIDDFKKMLSRKIPHELLTPLVGILGFSEILEKDVESLSEDEIRMMAEKIKSSGKRLQRRIEKFTIYLDLVNQITAKNENKSYYSERNALFEIDPTCNSLKLKNIAASFNRAESLNVHLDKTAVCISEENFAIVMNELIENAAKFSEKDTPIEITGKSEDDYYKIEIKDYGIGMDGIKINQIDLFNQNGREFEVSEGFGIGLTIVQKIISLCNGFLKIESEPGSFTKISLGLQLRKRLAV